VQGWKLRQRRVVRRKSDIEKGEGRRLSWLMIDRLHVTPAFLAPDKSPNESRVISKLSC
jgi:hypothetical protein